MPLHSAGRLHVSSTAGMTTASRSSKVEDNAPKATDDMASISQAGASKGKMGPSNDSLRLPAIMAKQQRQQQPKQQPGSPSSRFTASESPPLQQQWPNSQTQQRQQQPAAGALTNIAAAAAAAMQQHKQQRQQQGSHRASSKAGATPLLSPQRQTIAEQHQEALNSHPAACQASRLTFKSNRTTGSSFATRMRAGHHHLQQAEQQDEDPFLAQRRLHQLHGLEDICNATLEAAAGRRIMGLPTIICRAADGSMYEVATGHVQAMMLRRALAQLGVNDLTQAEERLLTAGASFGDAAHPPGSALRGSIINSSMLSNALTSTNGSTFAGHSGRASSISAGMALGSLSGDTAIRTTADSNGGVISTSPKREPQRSLRVSTLGQMPPGAQRRSAIGAALDAQAAAEAQAAQQQVLLDDALLERISRLDLFVENWRSQLQHEADAAKAAKAAQSAAAAAEAAALTSAGLDHYYLQAAENRRERARARFAAGAAAAAKGSKVSLTPAWNAVQKLVHANIANWQAQEAMAKRWKQPVKPPTWEDVIMLGDVYIKRQSGQGVAVYETRCAELGIIPCSQVVQQLEHQLANMAHCKIGAAGAVALAAALSAQSNIMALNLRDNGLDGKAVGAILSGIITATAANMTEKARRHNINFAGHSMASIGAAMQAAAIQQPPHTLRDNSSGGSIAGNIFANAGSQSAAHHSRGLSVSWGQAGAAASAHGSLHVQIGDVAEEFFASSTAGSPDTCQISSQPSQLSAGIQTDCSSSWTLNQITPASALGAAGDSTQHAPSSALCWDETGPVSSPNRHDVLGPYCDWPSSGVGQAGPDCPMTSQSGMKAASGSTHVVEAGLLTNVERTYVHCMVQTSAEQLISLQGQQQNSNEIMNEGSAGSFKKQQQQEAGDIGVEAQLALATLASEASASRTSLISPKRLLSHMGSSNKQAYSVKDEADELEMDEASPRSAAISLAGAQSPANMPASPLAATRNSLSTSSKFLSMLQGEATTDNTGMAAAGQARKAPLGRASLAVSRSNSNRSRSARDGGGVYSVLRELDLSQNPLGLSGAKAVAEMLNPGKNPSQFLVSLNLEKCNIPEAGGLAIATALAASNLKLRRLCLSNNGLGNKSAAAFGELLESSHTLKELDLSWNQIKADGARGLARGLAANATLSTLILCWNGLEAAGGAAMGDMLALNMGLKHLDLSHCRLGPEACLLLGEGIKSNVVLEVLLMAGNGIGEDGARHLMTALATNNSLKFLGLNGSNLTAAVCDAAGSPADFNPASPDGSYNLDLSIAAERAVAVQLIELDRANTASNGADLMKSITLDGKMIQSAKKMNWPSMLPSRGALVCTFASTSLRKPLAVMESSKLATLQRQLKASSMSDKERLELVAMFAPFALFSCKQIASITSHFSIGPERVAAASLLFTRASDAASHLVSLTGVMSGHDLLGWKDVMGWYAGYRWNQPTGHYELNLALPVHAAVAARLRDDSQGSPDGPTWINLLHDMASSCRKQPQGHGPPSDWRALIPASGTLSFDYVSTHPPGATTSTAAWGAPAALAAEKSEKAAVGSAAAGTSTHATAASGAASKISAAVDKANTSTAAAANSDGQHSQQSRALGAAAGSRSKRYSQAGGVGAAAAEEPAVTAASDQQLELLMRNQMGIPWGSSSGATGLTAAAATAVGLSDVAAADAAVLALRQASAAGLLLLSAQVRVLVEAFALSPHRVEVAVLCWPITLDRQDNYWTVLYCLQCLEQSNLLQRLGPWRLFTPAHASCHWVLDLSNPGHEEVAKKLVGLAMGGGELPNFWNIRLRGVKKQVNENQNMWGMLTAESFTPFIEFDFLGPDAWAAMGRTEAEVAAMQSGDKLKARVKQAARLEAIRSKQLYPYSCDGSTWQRPIWATYDSLMAPQLGKSPWIAAWDRLLRVVLRLELRAGGLSRDSSTLQEAFRTAAVSQQRTADTGLLAAARRNKQSGNCGGTVADAGTLPASTSSGQAGAAAVESTAETEADTGELCITAPEMEQLLRSWGYNKADIGHYLKTMEQILKADAEARAAAANAAAAAEAAAAVAAAAAAAAAEEVADTDLVSKSRAVTPESATACNTPRRNNGCAANASNSINSHIATPSLDGSIASALKNADSAQLSIADGASTGRSAVSDSSSIAPAGKCVSVVGDADKASRAATHSSNKAGVGSKGDEGAAAVASRSTAGARAVSGTGGSNSRPSSAYESQVSALAANLEASYERGITFNEFVQVIMTEPPKLRLKDVALTVSSMAAMLGGGGKGLMAKLKPNQQARDKLQPQGGAASALEGDSAAALAK